VEQGIAGSPPISQKLSQNYNTAPLNPVIVNFGIITFLATYRHSYYHHSIYISQYGIKVLQHPPSSFLISAKTPVPLLPPPDSADEARFDHARVQPLRVLTFSYFPASSSPSSVRSPRSLASSLSCSILINTSVSEHCQQFDLFHFHPAHRTVPNEQHPTQMPNHYSAPVDITRSSIRKTH